ncbi:GntR family transcriptional regulator [Orrella daihaiensis]|uniref:GntR family transcriptional regulator n=1 Tax=Orrella daihaiensis TaxID=2782176 RepID=A0ABY4AH34_9BURK|nr:GntR family transcriptional regulator [Orrella daihaiensis]UOD49218.1 GntR family transcriptional regulator [Orrella daihaiensis]
MTTHTNTPPPRKRTHQLPQPRATEADNVYGKLKMLLLTGALQPGQKLTLRALADQFGTSIMPIRDAIRRLTAEGGLQMHTNRTISVNAPTPAKFGEIIKIRCALEGLAAEVACRQMTQTELMKLRHHAQRFEKEGHKARPNPTLLARVNRDLHFGVYRAANMPQLLEMIESLWIQVTPAISSTLRHATRGVKQWESFAHHAKLIDSLSRRDGVRARQAIVADIRDTGSFILRSGALEFLGDVSPKELRQPSRRQHRL